MIEPLYKSRPVAPAPASLETVRVNDFITLAEGFSNCYLIQTPEGNIQLNAGMSIEAPIQKRNFDGISSAPLVYLILTQGHVDHVGGVQYFRDHNPGLQVIAQAGNPEHQVYDARLTAFRGARSAFAFAERIMDYIGYAQAQCGELPEQDAPTPDILFQDTQELSLGGLDLELIAVPGAETNDSLIVWLPQHKIVFTGNLFGCPWGHFPNLVTIRGDRYRDALTCARAVKTVMDLEPEMVLYGHHAPIRGGAIIREELQRLHGAILHVHDEVVKGMNAGKDIYTLQQEITLPREFEVGEGYGKVSWGVKAIWENYAGWFHHESTTELYSIPQRTIHADLLELAGTDAIVSRAQHKFDTGEPIEALHLLDIVFSQGPDHVAAVDLAIQVHESLAAQSENFWLSCWLENQLLVLREKS